MEKRNRSEEYATLYVDKVQNAIHSGMYIHIYEIYKYKGWVPMEVKLKFLSYNFTNLLNLWVVFSSSIYMSEMEKHQNLSLDSREYRSVVI